MVTRSHETDLDRLAGNIREELSAQNAMLELGLGEDVLDDLAERIAGNVDYAFACRWAPRWVNDGEPHRWSENADGVQRFFSECVECGWVGSSTGSPDEVDAAYRRHRVEEHASS